MTGQRLPGLLRRSIVFLSRSHVRFGAESEDASTVLVLWIHTVETKGVVMQNSNTASSDRRSQVHTEVRAPIEAVVARVVWFVFGFIEVLIAIRFVLKLLGANAAAGFVRFVYGVSDVFMVPFNAIFGTAKVSRSTFELSALVAIAIYALIAWGIVALIRAVNPRERSETVARVEKDDDVSVS
jgi:hypothetical protein